MVNGICSHWSLIPQYGFLYILMKMLNSGVCSSKEAGEMELEMYQNAGNGCQMTCKHGAWSTEHGAQKSVAVHCCSHIIIIFHSLHFGLTQAMIVFCKHSIIPSCVFECSCVRHATLIEPIQDGIARKNEHEKKRKWFREIFRARRTAISMHT